MLKKKGALSSLSRRDAIAGFCFAFPAIASLVFFFVVPFGMGAWYSFQSSVTESHFVGLANYADLLASGTFRLAAFNTARFIAVAVPLGMALSLLVSLMLCSGKLMGSQFFRMLFNLPLVLPVASVILFFEIFFHEAGTANRILALLGISARQWLQSPDAFCVLVFLYIWKNGGYSIILFIAALNAVPRGIYEAAELDSAAGLRKLFSITLPLIAPYLFFIFVVSIINAFKSFREAFVLCGDYPDRSIYMLQHFINNNIANQNFIRVFAGTALVFALISLLVCALFA
jgi:multiple sugar transport system permease protein